GQHSIRAAIEREPAFCEPFEALDGWRPAPFAALPLMDLPRVMVASVKGFFYSIKENGPIFCASRSNMGAKANGRWVSDRPHAGAVSARELGAKHSESLENGAMVYTPLWPPLRSRAGSREKAARAQRFTGDCSRKCRPIFGLWYPQRPC